MLRSQFGHRAKVCGRCVYSTIVDQMDKSSHTVKDVFNKNYVCEKPEDWQFAKPYEAIPGPKSLPIVGNVWRYLPVVGTYSGMQLHEINESQHNEFGDIVRLHGLKLRDDIVVCFNPKDIEKVYRNDGVWPLRNSFNCIRHYRIHLRNDAYQGYGGTFTADGPEWQRARSLINPILMQPRIIQQYVEPLDTVAEDFVVKMRQLAGNNGEGEMPESFNAEISKWALESIALMGLNIRLGAMNPNLEHNSKSYKFINDVLSFFENLYHIDMTTKIWTHISTPSWKKFVKASDNMTSFIQENMKEAIAKLEQNPEENNLFKQLMKHDQSLVFGTIVDMMVAGIDSTSKAMMALLYHLAVNQEKQDRLRNEIISILPTLDTPLTTNRLEKLPYMRAVIKESMRLSPVAIGNIRETNKDLVLSGYQVPRGTSIMLSNYVVSNKAEYFANPDMFEPERWLRNSDGRNPNFNPWVYLPFGFGARTCVGKRIANLEVESLLTKIIRNYKLEWHHEEMEFKTHLLHGVAKPLTIKIKPVDY